MSNKLDLDMLKSVLRRPDEEAFKFDEVNKIVSQIEKTFGAELLRIAPEHSSLGYENAGVCLKFDGAGRHGTGFFKEYFRTIKVEVYVAAYSSGYRWVNRVSLFTRHVKPSHLEKLQPAMEEAIAFFNAEVKKRKAALSAKATEQARLHVLCEEVRQGVAWIDVQTEDGNTFNITVHSALKSQAVEMVKKLQEAIPSAAENDSQ